MATVIRKVKRSATTAAEEAAAAIETAAGPRRWRIWFQGATDRIDMEPYVSRLEPHLRRVLDARYDFTFNTVTPPATTTHALTEFRMARAFIRNAVEAERQGYDAMAITHFQDAGLHEAKSVTKMPVLGLGETTLLHACMLGRKLGLVTINPTFIPWHEDQIVRYGLQQRVVGVRAVNARVSDFMDAFATKKGYRALYPKFEREVHALLDAGADVIVPAGGLPMLLYGAEHGAQMGGAPIVDGLAVVAKAAEMAIQLRELGGLAVSRRSNYAHPPDKALMEYLEHG
jgi:Asp/Glu/hydantoin racemase